jgi:3-oxoacyl-[acyl-carrier-protein] synthase III
MTALEAVSVYLPPVRESVRSAVNHLGLRDIDIRMFGKFGLDEVGREPGASAYDLLMKAASGLAALRGQEERVRYVIHARAMPVAAPYPANPLHEVAQALGLRHAVAFTVAHQSCASGLLAIDLAGRLLAADCSGLRDGEPEPLALILAGEKAFTREAQMYTATTVFGEGASACLVSASGRRDRMLAYAADVHGEFDSATGENDARLQHEYRYLLAGVIRQALGAADLSLDDVSVVLPHNVNRRAWVATCKLLEFPLDRVVIENVAVCGHVFCADLFINYQTARKRGLLQPGDHYVAAAVGAGGGATFAAMVFEH